MKKKSMPTLFLMVLIFSLFVVFFLSGFVNVGQIYIDADGDGWLSDVDCDDNDPTVFPGAPEFRDGKDNDCDGKADEGVISVGDVIITEIHYDPSGIESDQEWFEVFNPNDIPINMRGWIIRDEGIDFTEVTSDVVIPPLGLAVFCRNDNYALNGGVVCDYEYDSLVMGNTGDELILEFDGLVIDEVVYQGSFPWPNASGRSLMLDPGFFNHLSNDSASAWCVTPADSSYLLSGGDYGTPGKINPSCSGGLVVLGVNPDNGIDNGGEIVRILGSGFTGATSVQFGGITCPAWQVLSDNEISCTTPAHAVGDVDVTIQKGPEIATLTSGFRYTGEGDIHIDWAALMTPASTTSDVGVATELLYGQVENFIYSGVCPAYGTYPTSELIAEVGYGPHLTDPRNDPGWLWFNARCNTTFIDTIEFVQSLTIPVAGVYSYTYRFSGDGGLNFIYADLDSTINGFDPYNLGTITVGPDISIYAYKDTWDVPGDLAGWHPNTIGYNQVEVMDIEGNPRGYLYSYSTAFSGKFYYAGASTEKEEFTGDLSIASLIQISFDVKVMEGAAGFEGVWLGIRYNSPEIPDWMYQLSPWPMSDEWVTYTITFDPNWTNSEANSEGWVHRSTDPSFSETMSDVLRVDIYFVGHNPISVGFDNFAIAFGDIINIPGFTHSGSNITVIPSPGVTITFDNVEEAGYTSVETSPANPAPDQEGIVFLGTYYDLSTSAPYSGEITITLNYDEADIPAGKTEYDLRIFHLEGTSWVDRTSSIDTVQNTITAIVPSLSWFALGVPNQPPIANAGTDIEAEQTSEWGANVQLNGSGSSDPDGDPLSFEWGWNANTASGVSPIITLPPGLTSVSLTVSDGYLSDSDTVDVLIVDTMPPQVNITFPTTDLAVQDGITLGAVAVDVNVIADVYFYIRVRGGASCGFEDLPGEYNSGTGEWQCDFDTTQLEDGYYEVVAKAIDSSGKEGWSDAVPFSIRNWAVLVLLPNTESNKAGRTMPIKFSLHISAAVDPAQPFVFSRHIEVKVFEEESGELLQTSHYGLGSRDYRIDLEAEHYIVNFKTSKTPAKYVVRVYKIGTDFEIDHFTFETVK